MPKYNLFKVFNGSLVRLDLIKQWSISYSGESIDITGDGVLIKKYPLPQKALIEKHSMPDPEDHYFATDREITQRCIIDINKVKEEAEKWILINLNYGKEERQ